MDTCMNGLRFARRLLLRDKAVEFSPRTLFLPNGLLVLVLPLADDPTTHSATPGINTCARTFQMAIASRTRSVSAAAAACLGLRGLRTVYAKVCPECTLHTLNAL